MNSEAIQIKVNDTKILILDLKVMLNRLEQAMKKIKNGDKDMIEIDKLLKCIDRDYIVWNESLSYNIKQIRDMLQK